MSTSEGSTTSPGEAIQIEKVVGRGMKPVVQVTRDGGQQSDEEQEPSPISSEQLLRRPSFKRILDDLSQTADALKTTVASDPLVSAAAATVQAQVQAQQALLQQASLSNPGLLPLLQGLQQNSTSNTSANNATDTTLASQLAAAAMMLPGGQFNPQTLQLQTALLGSQAQSLAGLQSPLIAGAATIAGQNNLQVPANILSSAILSAASQNSALSNLNLSGSSPLGSGSSVVKMGRSLVESGVGDDSTRKREVRLMKNREAARECRRKKKEYIRCLENRVAVLESQNQALIGELRALKELYLPKNQE